MLKIWIANRFLVFIRLICFDHVWAGVVPDLYAECSAICDICKFVKGSTGRGVVSFAVIVKKIHAVIIPGGAAVAGAALGTHGAVLLLCPLRGRLL